jgi:glycosyltransferase involved in cell wall biosynthesis
MVNTSNAKVSVVVPNYNHARFLRKRVDSILGQTFQDFELILLDDCSTDDSRSVLSKYADDPRVRIEFNEVNSGSTFKQWNKGVRLARGVYVWIAESDDYADEKLLERLVAVLNAEPQVVFANCRSWRVNEKDQVEGYADSYLIELDGERWASDFIVDGREECRNAFVRLNPVCNASSVVFRRSVYEKVGGADESLRFCGDWKVWAAMALEGRLEHISALLNYHRVHDSSVTAEVLRGSLAAAEYLQVVRWLLERVTPTDLARQKLSDTTSWASAWAMAARSVPLRRRWSILRDALAIDPNILLRMVPERRDALKRRFLQKWRAIRSEFLII